VTLRRAVTTAEISSFPRRFRAARQDHSVGCTASRMSYRGLPPRWHWQTEEATANSRLERRLGIDLVARDILN